MPETKWRQTVASIREMVLARDTAGIGDAALLELFVSAADGAAFEAIVRAAEARADFRARLEESAARLAALKAACTVALPAPTAMLPSLLGTPAHRALAGSFGEAPPSGAASSPAAD